MSAMAHEPVVKAATLARMLRYEELRNDGVYPTDAARDVGVGHERGKQYERWYRKRTGAVARDRFNYPGASAHVGWLAESSPSGPGFSQAQDRRGTS